MHQQHAAVFQKQRGACFIGFVFKRKLPFPAQTQGGDGRFLDEFGLVVETAPGAGTKVSFRVPKFAPGIHADG